MLEDFSQAETLFLSVIMFTYLFAGVRLRSLISTVAWSFSAIALIGVMAFELQLIYFWFMLILNTIAIAISSYVYTFYAEQV